MFSTRFWILGLLSVFAAIVPASAQAPSPEPPPAAAAAPLAAAGRNRVDYGVRFGPSFTTLTSVETLDITAAAAAFEPTLNFGGFVAFRLRGSLSLQPEVLFAAKGQRVRDTNAQPITTSTGEKQLPPADRVILVRYLEIPLLLRMSKQTHEDTSLYLIGGPAFALRRTAIIRQVADSGQREDIVDLVTGGNFAYIVGGGLQHERWLVDARFTRGVRNIAADPTPAPVKTRAFSVLMGVRF